MGATERPQSFLAFDFGLKRTGVASGSTLLGRAEPLTTIAAEGDARFAPIQRLIADWRPDALVVGVPCHPDGAPHENTARARRFARQLHGRFGLPVHEVDERYTTTEALADAREADAGRRAGSRRRGAAGAPRELDAAAAALILEQFLRALPAGGGA